MCDSAFPIMNNHFAAVALLILADRAAPPSQPSPATVVDGVRRSSIDGYAALRSPSRSGAGIHRRGRGGQEGIPEFSVFPENTLPTAR